MLPEFRTRKIYDIKAAWTDFYNDPSNADIVDEINKNLNVAFEDYVKKHPEDADIDLNDYIEYISEQGIKKYQFAEKTTERFSKWFKNKENLYLKGKRFEKIQYNYDKAPQEQSLKARNNAIIDMMWGVLTNEDTAGKLLNPGNFDLQKKAARLAVILESATEKDLENEGLSLERLLNMSLDELDTIAAKYQVSLDPLAPSTQVALHQRNMTGAKMIGIYANHNASHALMQQTLLAVSDAGSFTFAGRRLTSLHEMKNGSNHFISRNNSNYLAGSVDNVKDNTLYATNQNMFTGDVTMLLSRLGYNPSEIAVMMKQPIVMEMTKRYFKESREGTTKDEAIIKVLEEWGKTAGVSDLSFDSIEKNKFEIVPLMSNILKYNGYIDSMPVDFIRKQVEVGILFQKMMKTTNALSRVVSATRADTANGGAGPSIADTQSKIQAIEDLFRDYEEDTSFPLTGIESIIDPDLDYTESEEDMRTALLNSKLPFLQAFYTLGVKGSREVLKDYFPHFNNAFTEVIERIRNMTKTGRLKTETMNNIYNELFAFILTKTAFFGTETAEDGTVITAEQKRDDYINNFPKHFADVVARNPDIAENDFIKRLSTILHSAKTPMDIIIFRNVGRLTTPIKERNMRNWASLLYMDNPEANKLAYQLLLYNFFRNGLSFGPSTFSHLAPMLLRMEIPGYISTLREIMEDNDSYYRFIDQYVRNHLDNRQIVAEIPDSAETAFVDEDGVTSSVTFDIRDDSPIGDRKVIKKTITNTDGVKELRFFDYISRKIDKKVYYYHLVNASDTVAEYSRIEPLGYKNGFVEYDYNKDAEEMTTVFKRKVASSEIDSSYGTEYAPEFDDSDVPDVPDYMVINSILSMPGEGSSNADSLSNIKPNTEYRDANDQTVCGSKE